MIFLIWRWNKECESCRRMCYRWQDSALTAEDGYLQPDVFMSEQSYTSALMNYAGELWLCFWDSGLSSSPCSSKHCMIYQRLETACRLLQVSTEASHLQKSIWQLPGNAAWHRLCAWVRSYPQTRKLWWSHVWLREATAASRLPGFHFLLLFSVCRLHVWSLYVLLHVTFTSSWPASHSWQPWWCNAGLHSWMFEQKFHTLFQSCESCSEMRFWLSMK